VALAASPVGGTLASSAPRADSLTDTDFYAIKVMVQQHLPPSHALIKSLL
jgi:hypothetical protein